MPKSEALRARGRLNALQRHRAPDDPVVTEARRDLAAEALAEHISRTVAELPPLTAEQRDRLTGLLYGGAA